MVLHIPSGDKQVTVAEILEAATASAAGGSGSSGYMICSEQTFTALAGELGYTTIDIQFSSVGGDDTVSAAEWQSWRQLSSSNNFTYD